MSNPYLMLLGGIVALTGAGAGRHSTDDKTAEVALIRSARTGAWSDGAATFVFLTLLSEGALLFVAAQAGFLDGPRVLSNMALDSWVPHRFSLLSDRLVTQNGILVMGGAALATKDMAADVGVKGCKTCHEAAPGKIYVKMTLTSPMCAVRRKNIHILDCPIPPPIDNGISSRSSF